MSLKLFQMKFRGNSLTTLVLFCILILLGTCVVSSDAFALTGMCIRHCGHCKEIYSDYFNGQACAEDCILSKGHSVPDCNDPITFKQFLKKLI